MEARDANESMSVNHSANLYKEIRAKRTWCKRNSGITTIRCVMIFVICAIFTLPVIIVHLPLTIEREQCSLTEYTGSICKQELQRFQQNTSVDGKVLVASTLNQTSSEIDVLWVLQTLDVLNASLECPSVLKPWICMTEFLICDEVCVNKADMYLDDLTFSILCPGIILEHIFSNLTHQQNCTTSSISSQNASVLTCSDEFYFDISSNMCIPECGKWTYASHREDRVITVFLIAGTLLGILISTVYLIASIILHKKMFKFPSTFQVYACLPSLVYSCFDIAARADRTNTVCASRNLISNLEEVGASLYCQFIGGLHVYTRIQSLLWWMFYGAVVLFGVFCPMEYQSANNSGKLKYVHISMITAAITLPLIPVLTVYWVGGYGIGLVLNYSCIPSSGSAHLYGLMIPMLVCGVITLSILILIASEIGKKIIKSKGKGDEYIAEIKILILLSISLLLFLFLSVTDTLYMLRKESISADIEALFQCEARGTGNECSRESFSSFYTISNMVAYVVRSNICAVLFIFLVNFKSLKKCCQSKLVGSSRLQMSQSNSSV